MAEAAAASRGEKPITINEEEAVYTHKSVGDARVGWFSGQPLFEMIHEETKGDYLN